MADPKMAAHQQLAHEMLLSPEGLSQEQLEHRERSLQTLRDIQRMLFPDDKDFSLKDMMAMGQGPPPGGPRAPAPNAGLMMEGKKAEQGPLQAMMAQSQSLGKPGPGPRSEGPPQFCGPLPPPHRDMAFSPDELPPPGPPPMEQGDHMTPEQMAWLKLQQEFYEEKKRKQDQLQQRPPLADVMLHPHGPRGGVMRGPPPPYQMTPGERGPGFGLMSPDMEPGRWPDDMPKMADGRGFPPGQGGFGGPGGRVERFPPPQDALFQQGMGDKPPMGLPPAMVMEMSRMMGNQRDPGGPNSGPGGGMYGRMSPSARGLGRDMGPDFSMGVSMGPGPPPHDGPQDEGAECGGDDEDEAGRGPSGQHGPPAQDAPGAPVPRAAPAGGLPHGAGPALPRGAPGGHEGGPGAGASSAPSTELTSAGTGV
ncbi:hypothetical protein AAFF_G00132300 [Aldrovandia affinis]|uniref:B-cell lymphoma 9 beta-catenin binding domain-containing protein n=1 Tax=Aldrovandia affinis TaxID=143900 RepID=A0AAD7RQD1_9TELE|nr:hypothetical protein AAFF_G00132300 [Aldrovandia affinis]